MTAISPLRGSFATHYFSQRPFFLEFKKKNHLFVSLQYKVHSFFLASFCQMKFFSKWQKISVFGVFYSPNIEKEIYKIVLNSQDLCTKL